MGIFFLQKIQFQSIKQKKAAKMAMSGVTVQDACVKMWEKMKTSKIKACQFKLTANNKEIEVVEDSIIEKGTEGAWKKFTSIVWAPQSSPIKQKMISASSKDALKKKLDGCQVEWQLTDQSELEVKDRVDDLKDLPDIKTSGNGILMFEGVKV